MSGAKPLRADAQRNRDRVLAVAARILDRDRTAPSMRRLATEAEVGLGTIYRQFPTKEDLYSAILANRTTQLLDGAAELADRPEAGAALIEFCERIVAHAAGKGLLFAALGDSADQVKAGMSQVQQSMKDAVSASLDRAQRAGDIRDDIDVDELFDLLSAACFGAERQQWDTRRQHRALRLIFDGLKTGR